LSGNWSSIWYVGCSHSSVLIAPSSRRLGNLPVTRNPKRSKPKLLGPGSRRAESIDIREIARGGVFPWRTGGGLKSLNSAMNAQPLTFYSIHTIYNATPAWKSAAMTAAREPSVAAHSSEASSKDSQPRVSASAGRRPLVNPSNTSRDFTEALLRTAVDFLKGIICNFQCRKPEKTERQPCVF
jgi:hypothetical protein